MLIRWQKTIVDQRGNVQPGAVLSIRRESDQALVTIYRDRNGTDPYPTGTVTADQNGYAYFYAAADLYRITSLKPAIDWRDENLLAPNLTVAQKQYDTVALMEADTAQPPGTIAIVTNDPTPANNGYYRFVGGEWGATELQPATTESVAEIQQGLADTEARVDSVYTSVEALQVEALGRLRMDLQDPLRSVRLRLIGDSETWGSGASGTSPYEPNDGTLNAPRNTIDAAVSPTWANLLRRWMINVYADGAIIHDAPGSGYGIAKNVIDVFGVRADSFIWRQGNGTLLTPDAVRSKVVQISNSETGKYLDFSQTIAGFPVEMEFTTSAEELEIIFAKTTVGSPTTRDVNVYVDGVLEYTFSAYNTSSTWNNKEVIPLDGALHHVRVSNASAFTWRMQGLNATRRIGVANDGIVGATTLSWLTHVTLAQAIQPTDSHVFVMLGTNDRITSVNPEWRSVYGLFSRLTQIVRDIRILAPNADITLLSANAVTQNEGAGSPYAFTMRTVDTVVRDVAANSLCGFVSQYALTLQDKIDGENITPDGLHPGDPTQRKMFDNLKDRLQVS